MNNVTEITDVYQISTETKICYQNIHVKKKKEKREMILQQRYQIIIFRELTNEEAQCLGGFLYSKYIF